MSPTSIPLVSVKFVLLYNRSSAFGLAKDAALLETTLKKFGVYQIQHCDPLEPPVRTDCIIHLEQPIYSWMSWARTNVLIVNPEMYVPDAYDSYLSKFDKVIFKNENARSLFINSLGEKLPRQKTEVLPWATPPFSAELKEKGRENNDPRHGFACFLGGSKNRYDFLKEFLPFWRDTYPELNIFSVVDTGLMSTQENIKFRVEDLTETQRYRLGTFFPGHVVCSASEGYSYTGGEAEALGAFTIHNSIDAFMCTYGGDMGVGWFQSTQEQTNEKYSLARYATVRDRESIQTQLDDAVRRFLAADLSKIREYRKKNSVERLAAFEEALKTFVLQLPPILNTIPYASRPPILKTEDCPPISIITLLYNRKRFFDLACHNVMISDYPKDKIEWILVDDTDDATEALAETVEQVQLKADPLKIVYVQIGERTPVSEKRNLGVSKATNGIVLMMDDDDHYPETSFRRRVAWLTLHGWKPKVVACTTIACYDLTKAISAVNVPPLDISVAERISEATLTFYKSWWEDWGFQNEIQVGEGASLLRGRETDLLEIPPQQIIVAFSHGKNTSSRRVPGGDDVKPGCFWGFPKEFLIFVHGLAGIKIQEA